MNKKPYQTRVIVGAQWGDEGKGKISDYLAQKADIVVRYQGGNNAGHSIEFNNVRYALNHIPSGIFNPTTINIMGQGMVINPPKLLTEIEQLAKKGITNFKLYISDRAHVIMPYHLDLDASLEKLKAKHNPDQVIGTTKKGIGPAYEDKIARIGIRFGDFIEKKSFQAVLKNALLIKNKQLEAFNLTPYDFEKLLTQYWQYAQKLKKYVIETGAFLATELAKGKKAIFEGAQGIMLCLENGTYPFVTSSSPTASAVPLGAGINPSYIKQVTGIVKAYATRVGEGGMPTSLEEVEPQKASLIRKRGNEFGTVTKRPRRIGWLDMVALKHAIRVSGITDLAITLLDVLDPLPEIKIAYAYELDGKEIDYLPGSNFVYNRCQAKYLTLPGWKTDLTKIKNYADLPKEAQAYLQKISELAQVPVQMFSVGPDRKQTIEIKKTS